MTETIMAVSVICVTIAAVDGSMSHASRRVGNESLPIFRFRELFCTENGTESTMWVPDLGFQRHRPGFRYLAGTLV